MSRCTEIFETKDKPSWKDKANHKLVSFKLSCFLFRRHLYRRNKKDYQSKPGDIANVRQFCINETLSSKGIKHVFFYASTFARSRGRCWKPRPKTPVFNTSQWTWRMLMHWKQTNKQKKKKKKKTKKKKHVRSLSLHKVVAVMVTKP